MSATKKFFLKLAVVSLAVWILANVFLGPPGLSRAYRDQYKAEHDHYLEIVKSDAYKRYSYRPELNAEAIPGEQIDFVERYEARPELIQEQRRIALYGLFFDFFNAALVLLIVVKFGKGPLLKFLDERIAELRQKIESAAQGRKDAEARRKAAQAQITQLPEERRAVEEQTQERLKRELAALEEANRHSLKVMEEELADRKREEEHAAAMMVKRELVNQTIDQLAARYRKERTAERESALVEQFACELEKRS